MIHLTIDGRKIEDPGESSLNDYEEVVFRFIREWLSEKQVFELQTSGSTGAPKTIKAGRRQMEASARATLDFLKIPPSSPVTLCIDARFVGGIMQLVRALISNHPLQAISPSAKLSDQLSGYTSLGLLSLVPLQLYELLANGADILNRANAILIGGGPFNEQVLPQLAQINVPVYHTYGMTETLSHIALRRLNRVPAESPTGSPTGFPTGFPTAFTVLPGIEIKTDERSCLVIKGEVTSFEEVVTNDVVDMLDSHSFVWKGRIDEVVNSGGIKIFPEEIDEKIRSEIQSAFGECHYFSYGLPNHKLGQQLVLFVETSDKNVNIQHVLATLKSRLPRFHGPKEVFVLDHFFKTGSGKIDKKKTAFSVLKEN